MMFHDVKKYLYYKYMDVDLWSLRTEFCTKCFMIPAKNIFPKLIIFDVIKNNTHTIEKNNILLKRMLASIDLNLNSIVQIYKCSDNLQCCNKFIQQKLLNINCLAILGFGDDVSQFLFAKSLQDVRGNKQVYENYSCFFTYAPEFLLSNLKFKTQAYADLLLLQKFLQAE